MWQCPLGCCGLRMLLRHDGGRDTLVVSSPFLASPSTSCWLEAPQPTSGSCHKHRGWGLHLGLPSQRSAQDPKGFPHEDAAPLQAAAEREWKRAVARVAPITTETNQGLEANPASSDCRDGSGTIEGTTETNYSQWGQLQVGSSAARRWGMEP